MDDSCVLCELECELSTLGVRTIDVKLLRVKDGIAVARLETSEGTLVLKTFLDSGASVEAWAYDTLALFGVPTPQLVGRTARSLLMEDLSASDAWRLGEERDLSDPCVLERVAAWYRQLHDMSRGRSLSGACCVGSELDFVSFETLTVAKERLDITGLPVWRLVDESLDLILDFARSAEDTLTYNDFYYTNLAVMRNGSRAMMFDYNMLGRGYAYADVRNVCSSVSRRAADAFLDAYGEVRELERLLDNVTAPLVAICQATRRERIPSWVGPIVERLHDSYYDDVRQLVAVLPESDVE